MLPLLVISLLFGFSQAEPSESSSSDLKILADEMDCHSQENKCIATGNAIAEKLNDPEKRTLSADKLIAYFSKKEPGTQSKLIRIEAEGNVVVTTGETIIRGPRGTYQVEEEYAEIFDDVQVTNKQNHLHGDYGEVFMKTGQYKVKEMGTNPGKQVVALIFSEKKKS